PRNGVRSGTPADCAGAWTAGCGDRLPGRGVPSAGPAALGIRALSPGGRRSALHRGRPRAGRLAPGRARGNRAAPLATVHRADPRLQGDGGGVSAAPAGCSVALDRVLPWFHNRTAHGAILPLG